MAYGLRIRNAAGNVTLDTADRITRLLGVLNVSNSGSIVVPQFSQGSPFFSCQIGNTSTYEMPPIVSISGTTLIWTYQSLPSPWTRKPVTIVYGVY